MNRFWRGTLLSAALLAALSGIALALAGCGGGGGSSNPPGASALTVVVQPLPLPGKFAVACSNVVQDFTRVGAGEDVTSYWEGAPSDDGTPRYATDLLADLGNTLIATVTAPQDSNLYGSFAGDNVAFVVLACYPTTANNPRPDYPLWTDRQGCATHADRIGCAVIFGQLGSLSGGCVFARLQRQPALQRLHFGAVRFRKLRLRCDRPVSRRPALFRPQDR